MPIHLASHASGLTPRASQKEPWLLSSPGRVRLSFTSSQDTQPIQSASPSLLRKVPVKSSGVPHIFMTNQDPTRMLFNDVSRLLLCFTGCLLDLCVFSYLCVGWILGIWMNQNTSLSLNWNKAKKLAYIGIPSGKRLHNYGKIHHF